MSDDFESLDLGGRTLRYICDGEGTPTVVVEQGQGICVERGFSFPSAVGWARVFMEVQKTTRICMHDRAGLGSSDQAEAPLASVQMVEDLRTLLQKARIKPPYILVGQSIGGFNARLFAARYPKEVVGMVLVDSSHPDQRVRLSEFLPPAAPPLGLMPLVVLSQSSMQEPQLVIDAILKVVHEARSGKISLH